MGRGRVEPEGERDEVLLTAIPARRAWFYVFPQKGFGFFVLKRTEGFGAFG